MTPKFAHAIDPIFLRMLSLLEQISSEESPSPQEERVRILGLIDQAEAFIGAGPDWELAKYALVSWIDEVLLDVPWSGRDWWSNNVLEMELYRTRLCYEQFYVRAQEASRLPHRDALEVFYIAVVLGFRGMYRDPSQSESLIQAHGLPPDLDTWARQASLAIRLGQGRPPLASRRRELAGAPPLRMKSVAVWSWTATILLAVCSAVAYKILW